MGRAPVKLAMSMIATTRKAAQPQKRSIIRPPRREWYPAAANFSTSYYTGTDGSCVVLDARTVDFGHPARHNQPMSTELRAAGPVRSEAILAVARRIGPRKAPQQS